MLIPQEGDKVSFKVHHQGGHYLFLLADVSMEVTIFIIFLEIKKIIINENDCFFLREIDVIEVNKLTRSNKWFGYISFLKFHTNGPLVISRMEPLI